MQRTHLIWFPPILLACGVTMAQTPPVSPQTLPSAEKSTLVLPQQPGSCNDTAIAVIGALRKGDFAGASRVFEPKLRADTSNLQHLWKQLTHKFGQVKSVGKSQLGQRLHVHGYTILVVPVQFENGKLEAQVTCDAAGMIADLRFVPSQT